MAIAFDARYTGAGATRANYNEILSELGVASGGTHPGSPACLFHWMAEIPGGFRVTDVWDNQADFDKFIADTVGPIAVRLNIPQPQVTPIPIHSFLRG